MINILPAGAKVTDSLGVPDYQAVANAGYSACSRYLRNLSRSEIDAMWAVGLGTVLNDELGPGNEALGDSAAGYIAAHRALAQALRLGWDNETAIIYSGTDFDVQPSQYATCDAYYQEIAGFGYKWGVYGPWHYLAHVETWAPKDTVLWASAGWQTGMNPIPNMQQTLQQAFYGVTVDINQVITTLPVWTPGEQSMSYFRHDSQGAVYEFSQGYKWHCSAEYFYNALGGALFPNPKGLPDSPWSYQVDDAHIAAVADGPIPTNTGAPTKFTITGTADAVV